MLSACGGQEDTASTEPVKKQDLKDAKIESIPATDKRKVQRKQISERILLLRPFLSQGEFSFHISKRMVGMEM